MVIERLWRHVLKGGKVTLKLAGLQDSFGRSIIVSTFVNSSGKPWSDFLKPSAARMRRGSETVCRHSALCGSREQA
jgi:hypothetical protein